jgi:dTDP-glucose pyrophosphorylase/CBS domain-containing protein
VKNVQDIGALTLSATSTLRGALEALERGGSNIALVLDNGRNTFVGIVTDGDVRRALLRFGDLSRPLEPHIRRDCLTVSPDVGRVEVLELMQARRIAQVPIVDSSRRVVGLHRLHDVLGARQRPNRAVIMAGGRGSRLGALTESTPKPMLRVAGRPILERLVLHLVSHGITRVSISVNYLAHVIETYFEDGSRFGASIDYLRETEPLGTGGALALLEPVPNEPIVVLNGDLVTQADVGAMLDAHETHGALGTMAIRRYFQNVPFGCVEVNDAGSIVGFEEKPTISKLVNAGLYVLSPELIRRVPKGQAFPLPALFEACLAAGEPLNSFEVLDDWTDVGQREQLETARGGAAAP